MDSFRSSKFVPWNRKRRNTRMAMLPWSISRKLKNDRIIDDDFENKLSLIGLEDLIALKLEISVKNANNYFYGQGLYNSIKKIVTETLVKYATSVCASNREAASFLGISLLKLYSLKKQYNLNEFFENCAKKIDLDIYSNKRILENESKR